MRKREKRTLGERKDVKRLELLKEENNNNKRNFGMTIFNEFTTASLRFAPFRAVFKSLLRLMIFLLSSVSVPFHPLDAPHGSSYCRRWYQTCPER